MLVDNKECMYVFDRGYFDYEQFGHMTDDDYFFVSRFRKNTVTRVLEPLELSEDSMVLSDEMILIGITQNRAENAFRLIKSTGFKRQQVTFDHQSV